MRATDGANRSSPTGPEHAIHYETGSSDRHFEVAEEVGRLLPFTARREPLRREP